MKFRTFFDPSANKKPSVKPIQQYFNFAQQTILYNNVLLYNNAIMVLQLKKRKKKVAKK